MDDAFQHPDLTSIAGKRVTVMGLGGFGGGAAAVRFLAERGAIVRVSDQRPAEQLEISLTSLGDLPGVDWEFGEHLWSHFSDADFVVVNPAVPPCHPIVQRLETTGIPLTSEMNLFWKFNRGRVIAVTGSNGKSTTTALIHSIMKAGERRCWLGGNIGRSLLPHVDEIAIEDWVILELSSFQLHMLDRIKARPDIAIVTNFAPNHLDWHGTLDDYRHAKQTILRWQTENDWCVLNGDDADVIGWPRRANTASVYSSQSREIFSDQDAACAWLSDSETACIIRRPPLSEHFEFPIRDWCTLRGPHNLTNALLSATAAQLAGATADDIQTGLKSFEPLPHRLQLVGEFQGRSFYNDSISTTPESTIAALDSFDEPVVILAGGYDKRIDLSGMAAHIAGGAKAASLLGQTASTLQAGITARNPAFPTATRPDFEQAFAWAVEQSSPGDVILLSPGCASYDWFQSFVERGARFGELVRQLHEPSRTDPPMR